MMHDVPRNLLPDFCGSQMQCVALSGGAGVDGT
jgi:hypothetical protein